MNGSDTRTMDPSKASGGQEASQSIRYQYGVGPPGSANLALQDAYGQGYTDPNYDSRPVNSYSEIGFASTRPYSAPSSGDRSAFSPPPDQDLNNARYAPPGQSISRPQSGLSNAQSEGASRYQDQNQRGQGQGSSKANSVVIKVGMVGDAQIGKTSLMVKYVEGSWDEDYIQTLGRSRTFPQLPCIRPPSSMG